MSRIIKFRVWDNMRVCWRSEGEELLYSQHGYRAPIESWARISRVDHEIFADDPNVYDDYDRKRFVLEQFTGFFDRNSREIWEGDILTWASSGIPIHRTATDTTKPQRDSYTGVVTWGVVPDYEYGNDVLGWTLKGHRVHSQEGRNDIRAPFEGESLYRVVNGHGKDATYPDGMWEVTLTAFEVAGNIHEHPNLLDKGTQGE